jgi:hypothetical protein
MKHVKLSAIAFLALASAGYAQTTVYQTTTTASGTLTVESGVTSFLQPLTLSLGPGTYTISQMVLGVNFNAVGNGQQDIFLSFYNNLDLSPGATDALAGATDIDDEGIGLNDPPGAGSFAFTVNFGTPITLNVGTNFGIVFSFIDDASFTYSTEISPLFRLGGVPSVGSNPGFVYNDADQDGVFPGSEQTTFSSTTANYYLRITATSVPVPEPSTYLMLLGGAGILLLFMRVRRAW